MINLTVPHFVYIRHKYLCNNYLALNEIPSTITPQSSDTCTAWLIVKKGWSCVQSGHLHVSGHWIYLAALRAQRNAVHVHVLMPLGQGRSQGRLAALDRHHYM